MSRLIAIAPILCRHAWLLVWGRLLRWRLETYGLYMPSLPNARPWWRVSGPALLNLCRHGTSYAGWVADMHYLRIHGSSGWWQAHLGRGYAALHAYVNQQNAGTANDEEGHISHHAG
jgi:hypothetical protein